MKKLVYEIRKLCKSCKMGSFATQNKRMRVLDLAARQLTKELGFNNLRLKSLREKHTWALVKHWKSQELSPSTIKSRMSQWRWLRDTANIPDLVKDSNAHYGIDDREYALKYSKAIDLTYKQIESIHDPYVVASLKLAKAFGLRKDEAIKINPSKADKGSFIRLKPSWCKGRRQRDIPILSVEQRQVLDEAKKLVGRGSLIPAHLKSNQQENRYYNLSSKAGFRRLHGLRHRYAQIRYKELTGWECPHMGGPTVRQMAPEQRNIDAIC